MKELHVCPICKRTVRLDHDTLDSTVQTNIGKCVLCVLKNTPQAGIDYKNTMEGKEREKNCCDRWTWLRTRVQSEMRYENCHHMGCLFFICLFSRGSWSIQNVCIEHLDQLTAAGPDIWTRPDQRKRPISVIYLLSFIFSRNHAFPGCYALLATAEAALVTMKNNNTRMQEHFSWP